MRRLVVAGGETSGAVVKALGVEALAIGPQIDPGVPWTTSIGAEPRIALALKSGNFGAPDFFDKALAHDAMTAEAKLREEIALLGRSIYERGLTHGSTGNISAKLDDGWLLTPTGSNLGRLDPARLSKLDWNGKLLAGDHAVEGELPASRDVPGARARTARWCICIRRTRWRCRCSPTSTPATSCRRSPRTT